MFPYKCTAINDRIGNTKILIDLSVCIVLMQNLTTPQVKHFRVKYLEMISQGGGKKLLGKTLILFFIEEAYQLRETVLKTKLEDH